MGQNPKKPGQWDIPFPVGQSFNVHWQYGIEWTGVTIVRSRLFREDEKGFSLRFNYTDRRDEFKITTNQTIANITDANTSLKITSPSGDDTAQQFGTHKKDDEKNEWTVVANGMVEDRGLTSLSTMKVETVRCTGGCSTKNIVQVDDTIRYWSRANDWRDDPTD